MMRQPLVDHRVADVAAAFWEAAGGRPEAPVDIHQAVALVLPLDVVLLARLSLMRVEAWLAERGVAYRFGEADRRLYGLLVVYRGTGLVFLDGSDPEEERRFTLAHEVAHFLLDYLRTRRRAVERLGEGVLEVLDGLRAPTLQEEVASVLAAVEVAPHVHLLGRDGDAGSRQMEVAGAEGRADALACELLAPVSAVQAALEETDVTYHYFPCVTAAHTILREHYGLPDAIADVYARRLARGLTGGPSLVSMLTTD